MNTDKAVIEQSMLAQLVYLDIVRSRHLMWASAIAVPEITRVHIEIAELIQQTRDQYFDLLQTYQEDILQSQ